MTSKVRMKKELSLPGVILTTCYDLSLFLRGAGFPLPPKLVDYSSSSLFTPLFLSPFLNLYLI